MRLWQSSPTLRYLHYQIQTRNYTRSNEQPKPEDNIPQRMLIFHKLRLHERRERQLRKLEQEQIPSDLLEETEHENFMHDGAQQKREERRLHLGQVEERYRRVVDVA
jgi:hypothetical protein